MTSEESISNCTTIHTVCTLIGYIVIVFIMSCASCSQKVQQHNHDYIIETHRTNQIRMILEGLNEDDTNRLSKTITD